MILRSNWKRCCSWHRKERTFAIVLCLLAIFGLFYAFVDFSNRKYWLEIYEQDSSLHQSMRKVWQLYPENSTEAIIARKVRVLCWIMTMPRNHAHKAQAVKRTWGERCHILLFISSAYDPDLPSAPLVDGEGRGNLWTKTVAAFTYIYKKGFLDQVDWILKADDDTFVVMENLRWLLYDLDPDKALFLGLLMRYPPLESRYMSGGAGYILSRTSARLLIEKGFPYGTNCSEKPADFEDIEMGKCMAEVGAEFVDTRDEEGRNRFHVDSPEVYMSRKELPRWYTTGIVHNMSKGIMNCCADTTVSFHYVDWKSMYAFYFATYRLQPFMTPVRSFKSQSRKTKQNRMRNSLKNITGG